MPYRNLLNCYLLLTCLLLGNALHVAAQQPRYQFPGVAPIDSQPGRKSLVTETFTMNGRTSNQRSPAPCFTANFYIHLTQAPGEQVHLSEIQTLPDGTFIIAGTVTNAANEKEGYIAILSNDGTVLSQRRLRIANKPISITDMKILLDGSIAICGVLYDITEQAFISLFNPDFTLNWLKVVGSVSTPIKKVTLATVENTRFAFAAASTNTVTCAVFTTAGAMVWSNDFTPPGMSSLIGFGQMNHGAFGLVANCLQAGKRQVHITQINGLTGALTGGHIIGDGIEENIGGEVHEFNGRMRAVGIQQPSPGQFKLSRNIFYGSTARETKHIYTVPLNIDFTTGSAMDNAGDVMGFSLPADGKLIFLRQFADYQTLPEHIRSYDVPVGSSIAAVARSFVDGGFLFGLNTGAANELLFLKTDSIGTLAGCGSSNVSMTFAETMSATNTASAATTATISLNLANETFTFNTASLSLQTDCNEQFCPDPPAEDTCMSTYFKAMHSNSYADGFRDYILMRNNRHLVVSNRYDRILGNLNQLTYGLKLFDERANFIKGVKVFHDGVSGPIYTHKIDSSHFMMIHRSPINGIEHYTFTKMNDDLQVLWTKSVAMPATIQFSGPFEYDDFVTDSSGNHYLIGSTLGFLSPPQVHIYKMDANGNPVWLKSHTAPSGIFLMCSATATYTSIVVVVEASISSGGSVSMEIDQATGNIRHSFRYANGSAGAGYNRMLTFDGQRIFYAGNDESSNFVMATFDTTGRPYRLKRIANSDVARAATVSDNKLYATFTHFNGTEYKNIFLKADSTLTLEFLKVQDVLLWGFPVGMGVGDNGSIYVGGNSYGNNSSFWDPYIKKLDETASLGTCASTPLALQISDPVLNTTAISFTTTSHTTSPSAIPLSFTTDIFGPTVSAVLCSSMPLCNDIEASGPESVCRLNQPYTYKATVNPGCTLKPTWIYDTAYVNFVHSAADSIDLSFKRTGTTWIIAKLNTGCTQYYDSIEITIQSNPALVTLGNDQILCPGDTIRLDAGTGFNSYLWQDGSTDPVLVVTLPGRYIIQVDNICGDIAKDTIMITGAIVPALSLGNNPNICFKDTLRLQAQAGFVDYEWTSQPAVAGTGAQVYIVAANDQTIMLDATTGDGCHAYDTLDISVLHPRAVSLGNDTSFCASNTLTLNAGNGYSNYLWSDGTTNSSITTTQAGTYWIHATDINGCIAKDTMAVLAVHALPSFTLGADFDLCRNDTKRLDPGNFSQYLWHDNSVSRQFTVATTGTYWVTVTDQNQCKASDTVIVQNILPLPANFLKSSDSVCQYDHISLAPERMFTNYQWSNGSSQPTISVQTPGQYVLTVRDANGCSGKDTITVAQKVCYIGVYIPTAFTPNNDHLNDQFKARVYGMILSFRMRVYNRWGELVFETTDPMRGWDGKVKGTPSDSGVFVWQCSYHLQGASPEYRKGTVTLIR